MNIPGIMTGGITEIRYHKLRAFLTLIGIILGTGSIIFMTSMLNGIVLSVWDGFNALGYDGVMYVVQKPPKDSIERARFAQSVGLRPDDAVILMSRKELVTDVAPVQYSNLMLANVGSPLEARVAGVTPAYADVRKRHVAFGRFFNENDMRSFAKVCILGHRLRLRLFGTDDPVGRDVSLNGGQFKVIGVGEKLGNQYVNDEDFIEEMEGAYIPLTTLRKYFAGEDSSLAYIAVKTKSYKSLPIVQAEIAASLSAAHHGVGDFKVENIAQEMLKQRDEVEVIVFNWQVVLGTIAAISLLVGGIGLLSVMIISINERLYEICLLYTSDAADERSSVDL